MTEQPADQPDDIFELVDAIVQRAYSGIDVSADLEALPDDAAREVRMLIEGVQALEIPHDDVEEVAIGEPAPLAGPEGLGPYRLGPVLGRGGQATVYSAQDTRIGRRVALKVLDSTFVSSDEARLRFEREARIASSLDHPAIAKIFDAGIIDGVPYIAMAAVDGESLLDFLARRPATSELGCIDLGIADSGGRDTRTDRNLPGRSPESRRVLAVAALFERIALALGHAHERGIVHRDIKPANLMVTRTGDPVILDFGVARITDTESTALTATGLVVGTPGYVAPEQRSGSPQAADARSDIYALGVTLVECITGRREAPRRRPRAVPRDLAVVMAVATDPDPRRRYATALAFAEDLRRVREFEPIAARAVGPWIRCKRWTQRHPVRCALLVSSSLILAALFGIGGSLLARLPDIRFERERRALAAREAELARAWSTLWRGDRATALPRFAALVAAGSTPEATLGLRLSETANDTQSTTSSPHEPTAAVDLVGAEPPVIRAYVTKRAKAELATIDVVAARIIAGETRPSARQVDLDPFLVAAVLIDASTRSAHAEPVLRDAFEQAQQAVFCAPRARPIYLLQCQYLADRLGNAAVRDRCARVLETQWPEIVSLARKSR